MSSRAIKLAVAFWVLVIALAAADSWHRATHPSDYVPFPDESEHTDQSAR